MGWRDRLGAVFGIRNAGTVRPTPPDWLLARPWIQEAGVTITSATAVEVSAVYGCCRLIVDSLAPAPVCVEQVSEKGQREERPDDPVAYTLNWGAPVQLAPDALPAQAIEEALFWSALTTGNGYAEIQVDGAGRFFALWPLEPDLVTPTRDADGRLVYVVQPRGGDRRELTPARVFHLRGPALNGWVGDSPVARAAKAIGIAQAAQVYSAAYFANGTVVSGVLKHPKPLQPAAKTALREEWQKGYAAGPGKAHATPLLDDGWDWVPINHDAQKSQLVEARRFQVQEIARFYGVPTTLLADNEAWTNLSELYLGFYRNALRPWAERFDAEATRKLFPQRSPWREVRHDLTHLTMGSFKETVESLKVAVEGGLLTRNEARTRLGANTVGPDGDVLVVGSSLKTLEDVLDPPEPQPDPVKLGAPIPPADPEDAAP